MDLLVQTAEKIVLQAFSFKKQLTFSILQIENTELSSHSSHSSFGWKNIFLLQHSVKLHIQRGKNFELVKSVRFISASLFQ